MPRNPYMFGNSPASINLSRALSKNSKLSKKVSTLLNRFNQGLKEIEAIQNKNIRLSVAKLWLNHHFNHEMEIARVIDGIDVESTTKNVIKYRWRKWYESQINT